MYPWKYFTLKLIIEIFSVRIISKLWYQIHAIFERLVLQIGVMVISKLCFHQILWTVILILNIECIHAHLEFLSNIVITLL